MGFLKLQPGRLLIVFITSIALFAPWTAPRDPFPVDLSLRLIPPCMEFPMGTDQLGRCVLSRIIYGTRISLSGAFVASFFSLVLGGLLGLSAALIRGRSKILLTGIIDMGLALPGLIPALVVSGLFGGGFFGLVLGLILANWPWWARFVRGLCLTAWEKEYVMAGKAAGIKLSRLVMAYIIPQIRNEILAAFALKTGRIILAFAGLSYLGLGPAPPAPEWGRMIHESSLYMIRAPWMMLAPGAAITLVVAGLNMIADEMDV